jgi:hypothetical protein
MGQWRLTTEGSGGSPAGMRAAARLPTGITSLVRVFPRWALENLIDRWASYVNQITQHAQATTAQIYCTISASQRLR